MSTSSSIENQLNSIAMLLYRELFQLQFKTVNVTFLIMVFYNYSRPV